MVLDIIGGAVLLAFGILSVYYTIDGDLKDEKFLIILLIGIAAIVGGGWILITRITLATLLTKIAGLILIVIGIFMAFEFPDVSDYQDADMSKTGIFIGLIFLIVGIYLLIFA
ncbi:hypothetical protein HYZ41_01515 [archaeon]|nr:hypothetical protein [archaeon]